MTFASFLKALAEPDLAAADLSTFWETSMATLPVDGLPFLEKAFIEQHAPDAGLLPEELPLLIETTPLINGDATLKALAWHAYRRLVFHSEAGSFFGWPTLVSRLGEGGAKAFYLLVALAGVPHLQALHRQLGVPEAIGAATRKMVRSIEDASQEGDPGSAGRRFGNLNWMRHYYAGRLFRIGRMNWMMHQFQGRVHAFRHRESGEVTLLAEGGVEISDEGFFRLEGDTCESPWQTTLRFGSDEVEGHPLRDDGSVSRTPVALARENWEHRLGRGMNCLDLHIPAGGGITPELCRASYLAAVEFFETVFPHWAFTAFAGHSWVLEPVLQKLLPPEANLVLLQKEVHLFPVASRGYTGIEFLFGGDRLPEALPGNATRLQAAIYHHLRQGGSWRGGGMVLLKEELPRFFRDEGTQEEPPPSQP